jgi:glycosyltransferase involved in cell wall biosynthesis
MAHGLPVVATTGGAIPELVPDSAGLLVPPGDVAALAGALRRLIADAPLRARLAAGAAAVVLPSWDETVDLWRAAAERLVA